MSELGSLKRYIYSMEFVLDLNLRVIVQKNVAAGFVLNKKTKKEKSSLPLSASSGDYALF